MKTSTPFIITLVFFLLFIFNTACEVHDEYADPVTVNSGRLHFNSQDELSNFIGSAKAEDYSNFKTRLRDLQSRGFQSLMPMFTSGDRSGLMEYQAFRFSQRKTFYQHAFDNMTSNAKIGNDEIDIDEDEFIADPYFAALLNRDREIQVGKSIYKFTPDGILFSDIQHYAALEKSAADLATDNKTKRLSQGIFLYAPTIANAVNCSDPVARCAPGEPAPGTTPDTESGTATIALTKTEAKANLKICFWDPNIWDDIFGPAESCIDHFENDKRIKTKTWSQNYLIYASVGIKVESQNRLLRIWWAENINEVELGYTSVYFEYQLPTPSWKTNQTAYQFQYGDYRINQYGQYIGSTVGGPQSLFADFPIKDRDKRVLTIYLFQPLEKLLGKSSLDLTARDVNNGIESLVKEGFTTMTNYLKKEINGASAVIVYPSESGATLKFLFTNWVRTNANDNKISEIFDWNTAVIGFSSKGWGTSSTPIYDSPQKYKKLQVICYGMGRRSKTWRGSRVVLIDTK